MPTVPGQATNPYLSLVEDGKRDDALSLQPAAPAQVSPPDSTDNPYMRTLLSRKLTADMATNAAILPSIDVNPDEYAGHLTLAKESGLPVGAVQVDPESIARDQRRNRIVDTIVKSPTLQAWTAIDDNAVLAMDDFENLSALESAMRVTRDTVEAPLKGFNRGLGSGIKGLGDLMDAFAYEADKTVFGEQHATQYIQEATAAPWWQNPSNALRGVGGWVEAQAGGVLPDDRRNLVTDVGEGFGNLVAQALATRLNPTAGVGLMAGQGADAQAERADQAGATQDQKAKAVVLGAAITAATERMGLDMLLDRLPPNIKNATARWIVDKTIAAGIEGTEEAVEAVGNNIIAQSMYDPNSPIFAGVADNFTVGAGVGFLARSLLGLRGVGHERQSVASEQTSLDGMVAAANASKLLQRAPERFQTLAQQMAQAGAENVYVPAEEATKLFQSMTPPQVADALGVSVETYMEALITGGDVAIPVEQYLSRVAPEHHEALREVARFTPGSMTPAEAAAMEGRAAEAADRFTAAALAEQSTDQMVFDDVSGMLLGTGRFRREDVDRYAQLVQAGFRTLAAREGKDPFSLYQRYRLRIKSELPAALQAVGESGASLPDSMVQVFDQGAASDVEVTAKTKSGEFRLRDTAAAAGTDFSEFGQVRQVEALDGERVIGTLIYANDGTPPTVEVDPEYRRRGVGTAMLKLARQQGGVLGDAADGIRGRGAEYRTDAGQAFRSQADESAVTLFQSADQTQTPEFKKWFGESKVVDADGRPLVVYHGAGAKFDIFDSNKIGASNGRSEGPGFYFTTDKSVGEMYSDRSDGGQLLEVYLSIENPLRYDAKPFSRSKISKLLAETAREEMARDSEVEDWRDGYLANYVYTPDFATIEAASTEAAKLFEGVSDTALDQVSGIVGGGVPADYVNAAVKKALGFDGYVAQGFGNAGTAENMIYVAMDSKQIKSATGNSGAFDPNNPSILNQSDRNAEAIRRGYIKFGSDRHFTIALLEKADATTFLHETGHFFLEVLGDMASDPQASDAIRSDYATLLAWFGVDSRDQIKTEHHEQFARGFEQYLGEGKAPNPELASAFVRFKAWVKAIYRTLSALNTPLTDDVRGVMDRLIATDEEITQAEQSMDYEGLFADARSAGWSDAEFATRLQLQTQAREEAESRLMARAMKDVTRETKSWWKERSADVREEVVTEVHAMPVYRAWAMLANGTQPDGTPIEGAGQKLDKAWLATQYGQEWLNKHLLRKRVYSVTGGADPDVVATGVGFGSGDEMVRALANMQPMEAVIRAQTHARMIDQYGDVMTDGSMPEAAMRAVHGSRRFKAMEADLKALERLAGDPRPSATGLRRTAELIVGQKKVRDMQPNTYLRAERKAAKEAIKASGQQKWGEALEAQRRRLLNAHLFDVASKAQAETEKLHRYLKKFQKPALRARLGKIGRLEQVETLLDQYDLRTVSGRKIDQAKARGELLALIQSGEVIAPAGLVASLQSGQRTNWRELTVEDLRGLRDVLAQTEAAARAEYEALVNGERVKLDDIAEQVGASTIGGGKPVMPIYGDLSPDESAKKWGKQMLASWLRPSALARLLDGGKDDGAWTRHVIQPVRRAVSEVLEPMKHKAHNDLAELYRKHYTVKEMAAMNERSVVTGLGLALSRWDVISLALNQGNAENRKAVIDSEVAGKQPYTEQGVQAAMATLDARDWAFVQDTWDYVDTFWPAIKEAQVRRKGIAPPKVEAMPFTVTTRDGQTIDLKGGYYPLKYNARLDAKARQHDMDEAFERMRAGTLSATQTKYGHTQERVGSGKQPVMLSMNVLHSHVNNVIMDLALGDVVGYTDRLLARPQVRQSLIETGNLDALDTWKLWLKDTATGEIGARSGLEQMAQFVRLGFTKSKVGFNAMTVVLQLTGLAQTIPVVGAGHTAAAALDFAGRPRAAIKQVMGESAFMRTRYELNAFNKDIAAVQEALRGGAPVGKGSGFIGGFITAVRAVQLPPRLVSWAFFGIRQMQILVDSTTWLAGYRRASGEGKSHDEAVRYADGIVENAQTSGMFSDRSAIERGTLSETTRQAEYVKIWTTLISYMLAKGNIAFESYRRTDFKSPSSVLSFGSDMLLLFAAEALLMGLIKGGLPDLDDPEAWLWWTGKTAASQAVATIPIVREIPSMKYSGGNTPIGATAGDIYKAINQTQQAEVDEALVKAYVNLVGTATGLPSAQINRAVDAYWREQAGEDVPAYEYVTGQRK